MADPDKRVVHTCLPWTRRHLATALHEIGHIARGHTSTIYGTSIGIVETIIRREHEAWEEARKLWPSWERGWPHKWQKACLSTYDPALQLQRVLEAAVRDFNLRGVEHGNEF